jgi:hypothetical protein
MDGRRLRDRRGRRPGRRTGRYARSVRAARFVCAFGDSRRLIDIYRLASGGPRGECRVDYTRNGVTTRVWSAKGDYAYCVKKAVGLVTTLSKGHFTCKPQTAEPAGESPAR